MKTALITALAACAFAGSAFAEVNIRIDTTLADRTLALVCSGQEVDEAAVRNSPTVQAQIEHNSGLTEGATMDAYVAALRGASDCHAPTPDPFQIGHVIANVEVYRRKVAAISARQAELEAFVSERIRPYLAPGASFSGNVVLAVPYFSCGGFSAAHAFFIDLRCLDENIDNDFTALALLISHETFHAVQQRDFAGARDGVDDARTGNDAASAIFNALLWEGTAQWVGSARLLPTTGGGPLTRLNRTEATTNARRARANFMLLSILIERAARSRTPAQAAEEAYTIAFSGSTYEQMGYYVGSRMAADIENAWGAPALTCVMLLPSEQFILAHDAAAPAEANRLSPGTIAVARSIAGRYRSPNFEQCRP